MSAVVYVDTVVEYPYCGDLPPGEWMHQRLDAAEQRGEIVEETPSVYGDWMGGWLPVIVFAFTFEMPAVDGGIGFAEAKARAEELAAQVVGESDVRVIGVKVVGP